MPRFKPVDEATPFPDAPLTLPVPNLDDDKWDAVGLTVMQFIDINRGNRGGLNEALDVWTSMYEQRVAPRDVPWPNPANLCVPVVRAAIDDLVSRVTGTVFQPRVFTNRGNDPVSAQYAHGVEQFYNAEAQRNHWYDPLETCVQLAALDGNGIAEILWEKRVTEQLRYQANPDTGTREPKIVRIVEYDAPKINAIELRDFMLIPNHAPSIERADAVAVKKYMNDEDIRRAVNAGIFRKEKVELAQSNVQTGQGELSKDPDSPHDTYSMAGLIDVVDVGVAAPAGVEMTRGPLQVWQYHTNQFDLNGDGVPEENILWVSAHKRVLLGFLPFEYWGGRPFKSLCLWKRPNRFYGISVAQALRSLQEEANAQENGKLDWMDMSMSPMRWKTASAKFRDEERRWGIDAEVEVTNKEDFGFYTYPNPPDSLWNEQQWIEKWVDKVMGAPQAAAEVPLAGGTQQRSARAVQFQTAIAGMQSNSVVKRTREWLLEVFDYLDALYIQYGKDQLETVAQEQSGPQRVSLPKEVLNLDYTRSIAGLGGPLDKEQRRQEVIMMAQAVMEFAGPLLQGNLERVWNLMRIILETFDIPEVTAIIGTLDEAKQQAVQMAQAAQQQQQMEFALQLASHSKNPPPKPPGQPQNGGGGVPVLH